MHSGDGARWQGAERKIEYAIDTVSESCYNTIADTVSVYFRGMGGHYAEERNAGGSGGRDPERL